MIIEDVVGSDEALPRPVYPIRLCLIKKNRLEPLEIDAA